ncbi:MAG: hypothetical protein ABMA26_02530 [Limisphaerales bacterium]
MRIIPALVGLFLLLTLAPSTASEFAFFGKLYPGEGDFVETPAQVGGLIGLVPGAIVGGVVGSLALHPQEGMYMGGVAGFQALGHVVGAPFWCLKKVFYDGPRKLAGAK